MEAMGLTLDGDELRLARLRRHRGRLEILALECVHLVDSGARGEPARTEDWHYREVMGLVDDPPLPRDPAAPQVAQEPAVAVRDAASDAEKTLHNTIFRHAWKGLPVGLTLEPEAVAFTSIANPEGLPPRKLRRRVRDELAKIDPELADDGFGFVARNGQSVLAFSHSGRWELLERVRRVNDTLPDPVRIALVDVNEVALLNLFAQLAAPSVGMSILIYLGNEFSRLLFLRDGGLHDFSPVIHEGARSPGILPQCYGRIVAELDVAGVDRVDGIYVAGGADVDEVRAFFAERVPGCRVQRLPYADVFAGAGAGRLEEVDAYAIPIALAWKILEGRDRGFVDTNFLPADLRRGRWATWLAWHGWVLLGCCTAALVASVAAAGVLHHRAADTRAGIAALERRIEGVTAAAAAAEELARQIEAVRQQMALVDSLRPDKMLAADLVGRLTRDVERIHSLWLTDLSLANGTFALQGNSLYGNRIHRLAGTRDDSQIHSVGLTTILEQTLYQYDITGPVPRTRQGTTP